MAIQITAGDRFSDIAGPERGRRLKAIRLRNPEWGYTVNSPVGIGFIESWKHDCLRVTENLEIVWTDGRNN